MKRIIISIISVITLGLFSPITANADTCPTYNLNNIFFEEYVEGSVWTKPGETRTITWTVSATTFPRINKPVVKQLSDKEIQWIQEGINSQDEILDSITFQKVDTPDADLVIGYGDVDSDALAWWNSWWNLDTLIRFKGTIRLNSKEAIWFYSKTNFIMTIQHEVRNVLGSGDIKSRFGIDSVNVDPARIVRDNLVSDDDYAILRQIYGESTCLSNSPATKARLAAEAKAKAEAEAKAKAELEAQAIVADALRQYELATLALQEALIVLADSEKALAR